MLTLVLQSEHVNSLENMATAEYRRRHGTLIWRKLSGPAVQTRVTFSMENQRARTVCFAMLFETGLGFVGVLIAWLVGFSLRSQFALGLDSVLRGVIASLFMIAVLVVSYETNWSVLVKLRQEVEVIVSQLFADCRTVDLLLISVAAGFGEEILFRGALQPLFVSGSNPWIGILSASLLFGLAHALSLAYFIAATLTGIYFGYLAFAYSDLIAPIVAHTVYDFFALVYVQSRLARK